MGRKKPNRRELLERELSCLENIGLGMIKEANIDNLMEKYKINKKVAENLYWQTTRKVAGLREASFEELKAQILCQMDILYKRAVSKDNLQTALHILTSKAKVAGIIDQNKDKKDEKYEMPKIIEVGEADFSKGS